MSTHAGFPVLSDLEVSRLMPPYQDLHRVLSKVMRDCTDKKLVQPVRQMLTVPGTSDRFISMPAIVPSLGVMGIKVVCAVPSNKERDLPTHLGSIQLYNLTGELVCQMEAGEITAKRTAVVSAVATTALANPLSRNLAVLGAGVQAESHIWALRGWYPLQKVTIWNRTRSRADELASKVALEDGDGGRSNYLECVVADSIEAACRDADIICTVTGSSTPLLFRHHVKLGAHINCVGASTASTRELADDIMLDERVLLYVDSLEAARVEAGDVVMSGAVPKGEIGSLLDEGTQNSAYDSSRITVFKNLGLACQDVATAHLVHQNLLRSNPT